MGLAIPGPLDVRWWQKVIPTDGCWHWTGALRRGYGAIKVGDVMREAHRVGYELLRGPIPEGLQIDHLCRNPGCVNPDHMEPVTARENTLRGVSPSAKAAKKTHCKNGHLLPDNPSGERRCRICKNVYNNRWYHKKKAAASAT